MTSSNNPVAVREQYATDENLRIRQEIHEKYTIPKRDFREWVLSCGIWRGDEAVLDLGCGFGSYYEKLKTTLPDIAYIGLDLSPAMLVKHPAEMGLSFGDAQELPFADATFDVVMAHHMMYHIPDIDKAIQEIRRVLKPTGYMMAATNSVGNMPEFQVLMRRAIVLLTRHGASQVQVPPAMSDSFSLESGVRQLSHYFYGVVRHDLPSVLAFQEVEPIMSYLETTRNMREPLLPNDVIWDDVMMLMRQQISQLINHLGELMINKTAGVIIASDQGGFIEEFVRQRDQVK